MSKKVEKTIKAADPELTTSKKLDQIKSGSKIKRQTGGAETKQTIITGKNGAKTVVHQTEEKFEETAVLRKKRNYVMYEAKLGTEKTTDITQIAAPKPAPKPKPKPVRQPSPRVEEKIVITKKKKEYLDNYQYHETKNIKSKNPRYQVIVEHKRLGDIIGGTFEETSYQRQVFAQGSNRPQITETTTTATATGSATNKLRANKSEARLTTKSKLETGPSTTTKQRTTTTTTTKTETTKPAQSVTAKAEVISEVTTKRRNEGTGSTTTSKTEKTTTRGGAAAGSSSTTTKTTTQTVSEKPGSEKTTTQQSSTTTTTKTTTTRTSGNAGGKTETKTVTKVEQSGSAEGGASSIRKKYAKGRFKVQSQQ